MPWKWELSEFMVVEIDCVIFSEEVGEMKITRRELRHLIREEIVKLSRRRLVEGWTRLTAEMVEWSDVAEDVAQYLGVAPTELAVITTEDEPEYDFDRMASRVKVIKKVPVSGDVAKLGRFSDGTPVVLTNEFGMGSIWVRAADVDL